jgi:hypothetical protein
MGFSPNDEYALQTQYFGDGKTYGRELGRVSPEGNVYGEHRVAREVTRLFWWPGDEWIELNENLDTISGQCASVALLPAGPHYFGDVWRVASGDSWVYYYWDSEIDEFRPIKVLYDVDAVSALPTPGHFVGEAHVVVETDIDVKWNGFSWVRATRHSDLDNNEPELHLPAGFITGVNEHLDALDGEYGDTTRYYSPDARVVFLSPTEIGLQSVKGHSGVVNVAGEWIAASLSCNIASSTKALTWNGTSITQLALIPDTHYWIYLANNQSSAFHFVDYDYRGKLFLSVTPDTNDYLGNSGPALNARLVGQVWTTHSTPPQYHKDLDISIINRLTNFAETYRDFSDYQLRFVNETQIDMVIGYGLYGQIAIADCLYYLGGSTLSVFNSGSDSKRVIWNDDVEAKLVLDTSAIAASTLYYIYIGADIDPLNFNAINPATTRPWQSTDAGSIGHYDVTLDLRLRPFLSTKTLESNLMSEEYPGYYIRHIGQITTDAYGKFINSPDVSAIKQLTLNPAYFEGLAEVLYYAVSDTCFKFPKKKATSGIVMVGGEPVETHEQDNPACLTINNTDLLQFYHEEIPEHPLYSYSQYPISHYAAYPLYVYLANSRTCWGALANKIFVSAVAPTSGYLSRNWPGNNARWLATIVPDVNGRFTGNYVKETISGIAGIGASVGGGTLIDDAVVTLSETWSSAKINSKLNELAALISWQHLFDGQKVNGLGLVVEYCGSSSIRIRPILGQDLTVVFSDGSSRTIPGSGLIVTLTGSQTAQYIWMNASTVWAAASSYTSAFPQLWCYDSGSNHAICLGWITFGASGQLVGPQNVYSFWNQTTQQWSAAAPGTISLDGLIVPSGVTAIFSRDGTTTVCFSGYNIPYGNPMRCTPAPLRYGQGSCGYSELGATFMGYILVTTNYTPDLALAAGIYTGGFTLSETWWLAWTSGCVIAGARVGTSGNIYVTRNGR